MSDTELVRAARAGDAEARKQLVELASLRVARAILGSSAKDRYELLRELARADGPAPGLGALLEAIAEDSEGELRRAVELVKQAGATRWGPPERVAIGRFVESHGR
jgi:hypothetical protein